MIKNFQDFKMVKYRNFKGTMRQIRMTVFWFGEIR
jgi:hypothetical protein